MVARLVTSSGMGGIFFHEDLLVPVKNILYNWNYFWLWVCRIVILSIQSWISNRRHKLKYLKILSLHITLCLRLEIPARNEKKSRKWATLVIVGIIGTGYTLFVVYLCYLYWTEALYPSLKALVYFFLIIVNCIAVNAQSNFSWEFKFWD